MRELEPAALRRLETLLRAKGIEPTARALGCSETTVMRASSGGVSPAVAERLEARLLEVA